MGTLSLPLWPPAPHYTALPPPGMGWVGWGRKQGDGLGKDMSLGVDVLAKWLGEPTDGQQPPMGMVSVGHCTEVERIASAVFSIISVREAIERKKSRSYGHFTQS